MKRLCVIIPLSNLPQHGRCVLSTHSLDTNSRFSLDARPVALALGVCVAVIVGLHLLVVVGGAVVGIPDNALTRIVALGQEANLPTFVSAVYLLAASCLLWVVASVTRRRRGPHVWAWVVLSVGFLVMSLDEAVQIHELVGRAMTGVLDGETKGWHYAWYLAYIPILATLLVIYIPFLKSLPTRYFRLFCAAGAIYVGGAVGLEMGEAYLVNHGVSRVGLLLSNAVEEAAELSGVVLLIYALLSYLTDLGAKLTILASPEPGPQPRGGQLTEVG